MRNTKWMLAVPFLLMLASATPAQKIPSPERQPISEILNIWVTKTEQLVIPAADAMPESKYSFAPSNGEFKGVRTFAEQVKHLAAANYQLGAQAFSERNHRPELQTRLRRIQSDRKPRSSSI